MVSRFRTAAEHKTTSTIYNHKQINMNRKLILDTLSLCTKSLKYILEDSGNLTSEQLLLLQSINETLQLAIAHIYTNRN